MVAGTPVTVPASVRDSGADGPYRYTWHVDSPNGQQIAPVTGSVSSPDQIPPLTFTPTGAGAYTVRFSVQDAPGGYSSQNFTVTASGNPNALPTQPPLVTIRQPSNLDEGGARLVLVADAQPNGQPAGTPYAYTWTVTGPGGYQASYNGTLDAPGATGEYRIVPPAAGTYQISFAARNTAGLLTTQTTSVYVNNQPPTIDNVGGAPTVAEGTATTVSASVRDSGADGPYRYTWTVDSPFGQRIPQQTGSVDSPSAVPPFGFTPDHSGAYAVRFAVQDALGGYADKTFTVNVTAVAPTFTLSANADAVAGKTPVTVTVSNLAAAPGSNPGQFRISYDFDNNGSTADAGDWTDITDTSRSFTYARPGTHAVRVRVRTDEGAFTDNTVQVVVADSAAVDPGTPKPVVVAPTRFYAAGGDVGSSPRVLVYDAATGRQVYDLTPFDPAFRGGISVAVGDLNRDGIDDIVVAPKTSGPVHVKVFDGATGAPMAGFFAFDTRFLGGASLAVGDVDGDGTGDIVVGAGPGGAPHVKAFSGKLLNNLNPDGTLPRLRHADELPGLRPRAHRRHLGGRRRPRPHRQGQRHRRPPGPSRLGGPRLRPVGRDAGRLLRLLPGIRRRGLGRQRRHRPGRLRRHRHRHRPRRLRPRQGPQRQDARQPPPHRPDRRRCRDRLHACLRPGLLRRHQRRRGRRHQPAGRGRLVARRQRPAEPDRPAHRAGDEVVRPVRHRRRAGRGIVSTQDKGGYTRQGGSNLLGQRVTVAPVSSNEQAEERAVKSLSVLQ